MSIENAAQDPATPESKGTDNGSEIGINETDINETDINETEANETDDNGTVDNETDDNETDGADVEHREVESHDDGAWIKPDEQEPIEPVKEFKVQVGQREMDFVFSKKTGSCVFSAKETQARRTSSRTQGETPFCSGLTAICTDPRTLEVVKLTKDEYHNIDKEVFMEHFPKDLFWAETPQISPDGKKLVYYSNRHVKEDRKPAQMNSLWVIVLDNLNEKLLISDRDLSDGGYVIAQIDWIDDNTFVFQEFYTDGRSKVLKYSLLDGKYETILEIDDINIKLLKTANGFVVHRTGTEITVLDPRDRSEKRFRLPRIGYDMVAVSPNGDVAYLYEDEIAILRFESNEIDCYKIPVAESICSPQFFVDEHHLQVSIQRKSEHSTWLLNTAK